MRERPANAPPSAILLATDLSARCDRALDRAALLALRWHAALHVVHAIPVDDASPWSDADAAPLSLDDLTEAVRERIVGDLRSAVPELVIHVQPGPPVQVILDVARREACELIVLGDARDTLRHQLLGNTVETIVRKAPVSVLIVKRRPRDNYRNLLVGTDFTAESRHGLQVAGDLFPQAQLSVLHALDIPYRSLWLDAAYRDDLGHMELATMGAFIAAAELDGEPLRHLQRSVDHGHPEVILRQYAQAHAIDLCVIGALRRGLPFHLLVGGSAHRIVQFVPVDIFIVRARAPGSGGDDARQ